jgi:hypothetical protein
MFLVLEFLMPVIVLGVERTVFERKLRNLLRENEIVRNLTFRDTIVANT